MRCLKLTFPQRCAMPRMRVARSSIALARAQNERIYCWFSMSITLRTKRACTIYAQNDFVADSACLSHFAIPWARSWIWASPKFRDNTVVPAYHRHCVSEHLWVRFSDQFCLSVPASSVQEQTLDIDTIFRRCGIVTIIKNLKVESQQVNGNTVLTSKVLLGAWKIKKRRNIKLSVL